MKKAIGAVVALALACAILLGATACGGGGGGTEAETEKAADLSGTVTVWDWNYKTFPEYTEAVDQIDGEFEKANPGVKVERIAYPEEGYVAAVRTALISGEVPDVITMFPGYNQLLSFTDSLEVLNDRISPELEEQVGQWSSVTPGLQEEGDHYGVPNGLNGSAFYYNKKLFAKAGLPTDFHPESWTELRETAEKLKAAGIEPFADGGKEPTFMAGGFGWAFGVQTELSDGEQAELAEGAIPYTDKNVAKAFQPMIDLYEADLFAKDFFSYAFPEGFVKFEEEEAAMVSGFWTVTGSFAQFAPKLGEKNLGIFPVPGVGYSTFSADPRAIPTAADNKDAAWALLEFELSKKSVETFLKVGNLLPTRKDVPLPKSEPVQGRELIEASQNGETEVFPLIALSAGPEGVISAEFSQIMQGRTTVEDVQKAMQEAAEKEGSGS